jgi:hypothetical protein
MGTLYLNNKVSAMIPFVMNPDSEKKAYRSSSQPYALGVSLIRV